MSEAASRSERLAYRRFVSADAEFLVALMNSPGWLEHIGDRHVKTVAAAEAYIAERFSVLSGASVCEGTYLASRLSDGASVGLIGLHRREALNLLDIGYAVLPAFYRKGYAYEAAAWLLRVALEAGEAAVAAICNHDAYASQELLRRLGFAYERDIDVARGEASEQYWTVALRASSSRRATTVWCDFSAAADSCDTEPRCHDRPSLAWLSRPVNPL